jgi:hypothetical protein
MAASAPGGVSYLPSDDRGDDSGSRQDAGGNGHQAGSDAAGTGFGRNGQGRRASAPDNRETASTAGDSPTGNSGPEGDLAVNGISGGHVREEDPRRNGNGMNGNAVDGSGMNGNAVDENSVNGNTANGSGTAEPETQGDAGGAAKPASDGPAARTAKAGTGDLLPTKAAEDDARSWGDRDDDHDAWLKEQRPPHWG